MKDIIRINQLAGLITEGQAYKMMQILNEESDEDLIKQLIDLPITYDDKNKKTVSYGNFFVIKEPWFGKNRDVDDSFIFRVYSRLNKNRNPRTGPPSESFNSEDPKEIAYFVKSGGKNPLYPIGNPAKILIDVYLVKRIEILRKIGLENKLGSYADTPVAASELDPDILKDPDFRKGVSIYIRKGTKGTYYKKEGEFEDEEGNTADVKKTDIEFLD